MDRLSPLIPSDRIAARVAELATEIANAPPEHGIEDEFVVLVLLKGAFVFAADLVRALDEHGTRPPIDFMAVSSYGDGTASRGDVKLETSPRLDLKGRDILLVDDILDSGRSLAAVKAWLDRQGVARVRACVLLDKPSRRAVDVSAEFTGFEVPDRFIVGYGLDHAERYRSLPYVAALD